MEIPVLNRIGDFEAGITSLHNPSFLSQKFQQPSSFLKWGALILAFVASLSTIIKRIKLLIFRLHSSFFLPAPVSIQYDYSYDTDTDTDADSSCSSVSSQDDEDENEQEDDEDDEDDEMPTVSFSSQIWRSIDDDFSVKGSSLRKRRNRTIEDLFSSFSELTNGKNVVKLWDNLGLRFNGGNDISVYDTNSERNLLSIFGDKSQIPAVSVSSSSPAVGNRT